jgi:hypothetical protein
MRCSTVVVVRQREESPVNDDHTDDGDEGHVSSDPPSAVILTTGLTTPQAITEPARPRGAVLVAAGIAVMTVLLLVAWAGAELAHYANGWARLLVQSCVRVVAFGSVLVAVRIGRVLRHRDGRATKSSHHSASVAALHGWWAWPLRLVITLLVVWAGYSLLRWGLPVDWVVLVAAVDWISADPVELLAHPCLRALSRRDSLTRGMRSDRGLDIR